MSTTDRSPRQPVLMICFSFIALVFLLYVTIWLWQPTFPIVPDSPLSYALVLPGVLAVLIHQRGYFERLNGLSGKPLQVPVLVALAVAELGVMLAIFVVRTQLGVHVAIVASVLAMVKITYDVAKTWPAA